MIKDIDIFEILEEKIIRLVEAYTSLRNEKKKIGEKLAQQEMEIQGLAEKVTRLSREKEEARGKVEGLLNRITRLIPPTQES